MELHVVNPCRDDSCIVALTRVRQCNCRANEITNSRAPSIILTLQRFSKEIRLDSINYPGFHDELFQPVRFP